MDSEARKIESSANVDISMATNHIRYKSEDPRKIGNKANITSHLSSYYLDIEMRRGDIKLEIRKHPRPYRRSRGGHKVFHRIVTITSMKTTRVKPH